MTTLDLEAEYNNRARVPEHPQHIAGWARDAAAFREATPPVRIAYGPGPRHGIDLFGPADGPVALFVHGGYWQALDPSFFSHMAGGANAHGVRVGIVGYDLCPDVTVATIIAQVRAACLTLFRQARRRPVVFGHSAGGHLTAAMVATDWAAVDPAVPPDLVPAGLAISGLFDLLPLVPTSINQKLGLDAASARAASPLFWPVAPGRVLDAWVGSRESPEYLRQSRTVAASWAGAGAITDCAVVEGADHFTVIAPLADPASAMTQRLVELTKAHGTRVR